MKKPTPELSRAVLTVCLTSICPAVFQMNLLTQSQNYIQQFMNESFLANYDRSFTQAELKLAFGTLAAGHYVTAFIGIFMAKVLVDVIGRKVIIIGINGVFDLTCSILSLSARYLNRFELLFAARAMYGLEWGSQMTMLSIFISEISPPELRGSISSATLVFGQVCILVVYFFGLPQVFGTYARWHYQFLLPILPALAQFVVVFYVPESPKYLYINRKKVDEARVVIRKLYGDEAAAHQAEQNFKGEEMQCSNNKLSLCTILRDPALRTTLMLATCLATARLTCGSLILNQYSFILYTTELGLSTQQATYVNMGLSVVLVGCGFIGAVLIDRAGRRPLVLFGLFGNSALSVVYVITTTFYERTNSVELLYTSLACILLMQMVFPIALTMVTYFTVGEITTQATRPVTTAVSVFLGTTMRILFFFVFPILQTAAGVYTMIILVAIPSTAIGIYLAVELPETKRKAADEVVNEIIRKKSSQVLNLSDLKVAQAQIELSKLEANGVMLKNRVAEETTTVLKDESARANGVAIQEEENRATNNYATDTMSENSEQRDSTTTKTGKLKIIPEEDVKENNSDSEEPK